MTDHGSAALNELESLLERRTGQHISLARAGRIESALSPIMHDYGIPDLDSLAAVLAARSDAALAERCIEAMLNNETSFFRDQASFALLTGPAMNRIREARSTVRRIRIWSSAASTGQEAISLAIAFLEEPEKWRGWKIEIFGTDVSAAAVQRARTGVYSQFEIQRGLPVAHMLRYFTQDGDNWSAVPKLRDAMTFAEHNLLNPASHFGKFDVVLCRNMLMYLDLDKRRQVFDRLAMSVAEDGLLMLGAAETVIGQTERFVASEDFRGLYEPAIAEKMRRFAS